MESKAAKSARAIFYKKKGFVLIGYTILTNLCGGLVHHHPNYINPAAKHRSPLTMGCLEL